MLVAGIQLAMPSSAALLGAACGAVWLGCTLVARTVLMRTVGFADTGGFPRWRATIGFTTQALVLPVVFMLALGLAGASEHPLGRMAAWSDAERGGSRHWATHAFAHIFGGLMLFDLALLQFEPMILAHHILCLGGLLCAIACAPSRYPYFLAGVMLLEVGSGACNFYWCDRAQEPRRQLYGWGMSLSNLGALCCAACWSFSAAEDGPAAWLGGLSFALIAVLAYMRQAEAMKLVWHRVPAPKEE